MVSREFVPAAIGTLLRVSRCGFEEKPERKVGRCYRPFIKRRRRLRHPPSTADGCAKAEERKRTWSPCGLTVEWPVLSANFFWRIPKRKPLTPCEELGVAFLQKQGRVASTKSKHRDHEGRVSESGRSTVERSALSANLHCSFPRRFLQCRNARARRSGGRHSAGSGRK